MLANPQGVGFSGTLWETVTVSRRGKKPVRVSRTGNLQLQTSANPEKMPYSEVFFLFPCSTVDATLRFKEATERAPQRAVTFCGGRLNSSDNRR